MKFTVGRQSESIKVCDPTLSFDGFTIGPVAYGQWDVSEFNDGRVCLAIVARAAGKPPPATLKVLGRLGVDSASVGIFDRFALEERERRTGLIESRHFTELDFGVVAIVDDGEYQVEVGLDENGIAVMISIGVADPVSWMVHELSYKHENKAHN